MWEGPHMVKEYPVQVSVGDGLAIADVVLHYLFGGDLVEAGCHGLPLDTAWKLHEDGCLG